MDPGILGVGPPKKWEWHLRPKVVPKIYIFPNVLKHILKKLENYLEKMVWILMEGEELESLLHSSKIHAWGLVFNFNPDPQVWPNYDWRKHITVKQA